MIGVGSAMLLGAAAFNPRGIIPSRFGRVAFAVTGLCGVAALVMVLVTP